MSDRYDDLAPWRETFPARYPLSVDPRAQRSPLGKPDRKTKKRRAAWLRRMLANLTRPCERPESARAIAGGKWRGTGR